MDVLSELAAGYAPALFVDIVTAVLQQSVFYTNVPYRQTSWQKCPPVARTRPPRSVRTAAFESIKRLFMEG